MNVPNMLSTLRVLMVPLMLVFLLVESLENPLTALIIFSLASITDFLDGYIARKYHLITKIGKLIDPLADKILTAAAFIALTYLGRINPWIVIAIVSREFVVSIFRAIAASDGKVIAASIWGKFKTVTQMATIMVILLIMSFPRAQGGYEFIGQILAWFTLGLTLLSAVDYVVKNIEVLKE